MNTQALSAPISSLSLLLVQTQAARWKAAAPEKLTCAHLYLDIVKSGYLFHEYSSGMQYQFGSDMLCNVYREGINNTDIRIKYVQVRK